MGVDTPKKQSPSTLGTTWSFVMGVMMTPALAREAQMARRNVVAFIFILYFFSFLLFSLSFLPSFSLFFLRVGSLNVANR